ncbi:MAG TPA: FKBP-type peptidyl-prolyl cis-trans isomerase [Longimicrobiales bacterium]|nr:FKBP-type peptidyl-prolyl cis-trans isomerase [Longimicrobiales bacterium]
MTRQRSSPRRHRPRLGRSRPTRSRLTGPWLARTWLAAIVALGVWACAPTAYEGGAGDPATVAFDPELGIDLAAMERTPSGLYLQDLAEGVGPTAQRTSLVTIHYATWLADGTLVDTSVGGDPFTVRLGGSEVIRGWNEGIQGMRVGGRRKLVVRPGLAYGSRGSANVPPDATLVFEVQLTDVR